MNTKDQPDNQTTTKDNSAVVESTGQAVSDGALAGRDDAQLAGGDAAKDSAQIAGGSLTSGNENVIGDIGNSAQVTIQSVDAEVVGRAGEALSDISDDAFGFGEATVSEAFGAVESTAYEALQANRDVSGEAFEFADEVNYRGFQFGSDALSEVGETADTIADALNDALGFAQTSQQAANDLSRVTNETLAMKSSDADSAVSSTLQKNFLIGTAIIAAAIVVSRLPNS